MSDCSVAEKKKSIPRIGSALGGGPAAPLSRAKNPHELIFQ
jgi:hypothetical protein